MRPLAVGPCPGAGAHGGHEVIVSGHPVPSTDHLRGLLTVWRCPVDGWGGYWHDLARRAEDVGGSGPPLDELPAKAEVDKPGPLRRLFGRH